MKALKKWLPLISLICGLLALVMIFLAAVKGSGYSANGLQVSFGADKKGTDFSILNLLVYIVPVVAGVLAYLGAQKNVKGLKIAAIVCFAVAAVLFFISKNFLQGYIAEAKDYLDLGIGAILGGIFSILGVASSVLDVVVKD